MTADALMHRTVREHLDRPQVPADHYNSRYMNKQRLASYWHQFDETLAFQPANVLEIGPGPGFTTELLRREGIHTIGMDIDPDLRPDLVASVRSLPFDDRTIDVVLCCQVLEHLPFREFAPALRELSRVAKKGIVVSLPDRDRFIGLTFFTLRRTVFQHIIDLPRRQEHRRIQETDTEHFWEIGSGEVSLSTVQSEFKRAMKIRPRTYRVPEHPWHRFFIAAIE